MDYSKEGSADGRPKGAVQTEIDELADRMEGMQKAFFLLKERLNPVIPETDITTSRLERNEEEKVGLKVVDSEVVARLKQIKISMDEFTDNILNTMGRVQL